MRKEHWFFAVVGIILVVLALRAYKQGYRPYQVWVDYVKPLFSSRPPADTQTSGGLE